LFSRVTPFLSSAIPLLQHHLSSVKSIHEEDIALGYGEVNNYYTDSGRYIRICTDLDRYAVLIIMDKMNYLLILIEHDQRFLGVGSQVLNYLIIMLYHKLLIKSILD